MGWVVLLGVVVAFDGAFSGYRAAQGRTGRLPSWRRDLAANALGLAVAVALLVVPVVVGAVVTTGPEREAIARAGVLWSAWLSLPTLLAVLVLVTLGWRWRYLAMALVLGPMTWLRPVAALATGAAGALAAPGPIAATAVLLAMVTVLLVEPVAGRVVARRTAVHLSTGEASAA
ncbi:MULTISPECIES: hypothetical protein [Janibacter]|uniref:Uncharacterized protein n=1 Tax=Janibacter indicus TaxID=857417 RepID=A0A1W2CG28_9MICO|nr:MULTISPECIES: hypothetical protein [Janibacter]QNF93273.1 hypothetical protein H7A72_10815 [Janibacter sp. YB324]SMC83914.1 hypothetical protein SAMN06296429_11167 [Janibacter indicus]